VNFSGAGGRWWAAAILAKRWGQVAVLAAILAATVNLAAELATVAMILAKEPRGLAVLILAVRPGRVAELGAVVSLAAGPGAVRGMGGRVWIGGRLIQDCQLYYKVRSDLEVVQGCRGVYRRSK